MMARNVAAKAKPKKASRKSAKAAAPKKAPSRRPAKKAAKKALRRVSARVAQVRAQVARRRPGMGAPMVPHEHQDPSIVAPPAPPQAPVDHLHGNYGDAKARSVARQDNPTNWFRQAPKQKQK